MNEIKLIVGLGNPEPNYSSTRHNAGFWLLNSFVRQSNLKWKRDTRSKAEIASFQTKTLENQKVWLLKPSLYMNESGISVYNFSFFYKIKAEQILIVHDELDLLPGSIKLKKGGGNAGHNGLKNVQQKLGSENFWRLRLGIGHPKTIETPIKNVSDFVLSEPSGEEKKSIDLGISLCTKYMNDLLKCNIKNIQNALSKEF
ncbi:MAG: aminoacyl-tRNA hydrolase [Betaproteobacteria bacterium TMED41]|nr:MAG: aminoacyl-tRNA hydrolase [Betaproteobacteria bacterium TMED41]